MLRHKELGTLVPWTLAALLLAAGASAQANPELGDTGGGVKAAASTGGTAKATWQPPTGDQRAATTDTTEPAAAADTSGNAGANLATGNTDHSAVVGSWGVGFFGVQDVPLCTDLPCGVAAGGNGAAAQQLSAPTIGVRYWLDSRFAIEAALGFATRSGSVENKVGGGMPQTYDDPSLTAFALHGAVPIALADSKHFTFEVIPELNFAVAGGSLRADTSSQDRSFSGNMIELGGRIGAEIHFGFISLPKLSLVGSLGLHLRSEHRNAEVADGSEHHTHNTFGITTSVGNKPWDVFVSNIAAIYYF